MTILRFCASNDNHEISAIDSLVATCRRFVSDLTNKGKSFSECESAVLELTNEAVRRCLEGELQRRAKDMARELCIDGVPYRSHQPGTGKYYSLCGELRVQRQTYRQRGVRNGPIVVPLELDAGLIERCTPAFAYALTRGYGKAPIRIVEQELRAARRLSPSRSTLDRLARALGNSLRTQAERLEKAARQNESVPAGAVAVNIGLDRTTIPMEEATEEGDWPRRGGRNITVRYRMAYVGTFTLTNREGEPLVTRRYAAPVHRGSVGVLRRLLADVKHALAQRPGLNLGIVQDNAPELWNVMRAALRADPILSKRKWRETVDWYHLMQYLGRVLTVLIRCPTQRAEMLERWRSALQRTDRAIHHIANWIDRWAFRLDSRSRKFREYVGVVGIYLVCRPHFRYASLASLGLHAGSGVTEGACKSIIKMRAHRSGQRWTRKGIDGVLGIASLLESERLDACWSHFETLYRANCVAA